MSAWTRTIRLATAVSFGLIALVFAPSAQAYIDQNPYDVNLTGPSQPVACTDSAVIHASVKSATNGLPAALQTVNWDIKSAQSPGDRLSSHKTSTADDGTTSVTLTFGPATGPRVVRATIATWPATITVTCSGPVNVPATPHPTPHPTANPTQRPTQEPAGSTPEPRATPLPGTDLSVPAQPGQRPDLWLPLVVMLAGSAALLFLRRLSRS